MNRFAFKNEKNYEHSSTNSLTAFASAIGGRTAPTTALLVPMIPFSRCEIPLAHEHSDALHPSFFMIKRTGSGQLLKSFLRSRGASCCIMSRHAHALPFWDSPPFTLVFPPCPRSSLFEIVTLRQDFKSSACTSPAERLPMRTHSCRCPQRA